ncbi:MAG: hypothetical protein U0573_00955 [Phycisphaerales bacterium]|nr:hypothetical protein [Planctomycetota bacterium]
MHHFAFGFIAPCLAGLSAWGQPAAPAQPDPALPASARAAIRAGQHCREDLRKTGIIPIVVIVGDANSFVRAIGAWTPKVRFPVLIDDGSIRSAENIARFVRAFAPKDVVRFTAADAGGGWDANAEAIAAALAASSGAKDPTPESLRAAWDAQSHQPPGIVVANKADVAWPAALALAAGHGQPLLWITDEQAPRSLHDMWNADAASALDKYLQNECSKLGYQWSDLGDSIDAVTICASIPNTYEVAPREVRATTDRIGRLRADAPARWAWCGQIFGGPAEACYRAMCPLFLDNTRSWMFDSYPKTTPWSTYSLAQAKTGLGPKFTTELLETPGASAALWREKTGTGIDAGLFFVNSKGNSDFFELEGGYGYCGDVPMLLRPAALHLIHSWSLQYPASRNTIGGRWLERGVYLYYGSVNEPTLGAFTPCPQVAELLGAGASFGGAVRRDQGGAWKLTVLGDPLATVSPGAVGDRVDQPLPLENAGSIAAGTRELIRKSDFAAAIREFILCGQEETAIKLAVALLRDRPQAVTPAVARAIIPSLMRAGRSADLVAAMRAARVTDDDKGEDTAFLRDCLWTGCGLALRSKVSPPDVQTLELLRANIRPEQIDQDLIDLGLAWSRATDFATAVGVVDATIGKQTDPAIKKKAARAGEELRRHRR